MNSRNRAVSTVLNDAIQNWAATIWSKDSPNRVMRSLSCLVSGPCSCWSSGARASARRGAPQPGRAQGGQRADQQADVGKQPPGEPGPPRHRQRSSLGAQVAGDDALDVGNAFG